jgi:hypothetical protein
MTPTPSPATALERDLLQRVDFDHGWGLIQRFSTLVRESGAPDEHEAADYIAAQLTALGIEHKVHEPTLYLSLPRESWVEMDGDRLRAKPPSFSASTTTVGLSGTAVYVPADRMRGTGDLFESRQGPELPDVAGKIIVTEGYAMPLTVQRFEAAGATGQIYINPGENIHWGICTPIWGTPTVENLASKPTTPVVAISNPDGERLRALLSEPADAGASARVQLTLHVQLEEGWYPCKLPVATVRGASDDFMLVHGHYDSWDVGIGDNAVGDATLLELARIFHEGREGLHRTLKVAWWPAHSTGRYGGSTWFADAFALELRKRCVAAVNIDSPGCWHATAYEEVMWMTEAEALCRGAIRDATECEAVGRRPLRAGDYSFNQIGLTSFFMLLSNIPTEEREALGFYPTGGCGGNIAWHTEDDVLEVAERSNLERDLAVYVTVLTRVLNAVILPFDFRGTVEELGEALEQYAVAAAEWLDLSPALDELAGLRRELDWLYDEDIPISGNGRPPASDVEDERTTPESLTADRVNTMLVELARILVPLGYAEGERFEHDPALPRAVIPRLAAVKALAAVAADDPDRLPFLQTGLRRRVNQVANRLYEAGQVVRLARE